MPEITFEDILGKVMLIGLSYFNQNNELVRQAQYWGTVVEANETRIAVRRENGKLFTLPPDLESTHPAPEGEYRLNSTGEVVVNPDFLSTWSIYLPDEGESL